MILTRILPGSDLPRRRGQRVDDGHDLTRPLLDAPTTLSSPSSQLRRRRRRDNRHLLYRGERSACCHQHLDAREDDHLSTG